MMATSKSESLFIPQLTMFLLFTGFSMNYMTTQLMIWHKTCLATGYDKEICEHLHNHPEAEDDVTGKAASLNIVVPVLAFLPAAFMTLVWGPLSDIYGRKKILIIPAATSAISALAMLIHSTQLTLSPGLLYGASMLVGLGGGLGTFMSTMISYVMDSTPPERRTERMSLLLPSVALGQTVGTLCCGILWEQAGASMIYFLTFLSNVIILISVFSMEEVSKTSDGDDKSRRNVLSMGGLWRNVTAGGRIVLADRQNGRRRKLLLLLVVGPAAIFLSSADMAVVSLHTRRVPFQWTPSMLSYFAASKTIAAVLGTALLAPIYIKVTGSRSDQGDLTVMCLGYGTAAMQSLVMTVASGSSHLLIIPFLAACIGAVGPATRSLASKLVHPSELGALNGFVSFLNNLSATFGGVLLVSVYTETVHTMPGVAFLTMTTVAIISLLIVLFLKTVYHAQPDLDEKKGN